MLPWRSLCPSESCGNGCNYSATERALSLQRITLAFGASLSCRILPAIYASDQALVSIISEKNASTFRHK